jgi:ABC-type transport system substrate-binding protein
MVTRHAKSHDGETREQLLDRVDAQLRGEVAGGLSGVAHSALAAREHAPTPQTWSPQAVIETALEDAEKAKTDLEAAGWVAGPAGTRSKNGQPLAFDYVNIGDNPVTKAVATATAAMMKNIGVTMHVRQVASSEFSSILSGCTFDLFFSGFIQTDPYGLAYFCQLYCSDSTLNVSAPARTPSTRTSGA